MKIAKMKRGDASGHRVSIRLRTAVAYGAFALLTAGVLAALLVQLRSDEVAEGKKLLTAVAQLMDEQTSRTFQNVEQGVQNVESILAAAERRVARAAASPAFEFEVPTTEAIDGQLQMLASSRPYLVAIRVLDKQGRAIYNSDTGNTGLDLSDRAYFSERRVRPEMGFAFSVPLKNRPAGRWVIPATQTVYTADAEFAGVIEAAVDPLFFDRVWTLENHIPTLTVTLFRADGMMLMRSPANEQLIGRPYSSGYVFQSVRDGIPSGTYENISVVTGENRVFAYRQLTTYPGMILVVGQDMDEVLAPWRRILWSVVSSWVVVMLALGGLTLWLTREWERRRTSEGRYRLIFKANPYPMVVMDRETRRMLAVNDAALEEYGWSREEVLSMPANDFYPPEDLPALAAMRLSDVTDGARVVRGLRHRKKDGTIFNVEMHIRALELDAKPALLTIMENVTARHAAEEQLRQSQKMEAVGQLTGGIAHDFNNILMVILANADALQEEDTDAATLAENVDQIGKAVLRASELTRQLLAFSRKQPLNPKRTDLNDLVNDTGKLLRRALGEHIEIESKLAAGLCTVNIDRTQLETALVNLCVNARDSMPGGGKLLIETRNVSLNKDNVTQANDVVPGDYAMLSVTDTGTGMPAETRAKVFEPFFTTKEVGKGTGLGLSMVYGFIKQSNGHITIHSEVGRGTTFRLYLPRSDGVQEEVAVRQAASLPRGKESILVVEDEPLVRASVVKQLQSLGYTVSQASDGAAGLASFDAAPQPYDLLLTDVVMPGPLNGRAFANEVALRWPRTKIVFISGYAENAVLHDGQADEGVLLLSKPFRKSDLAEIIRRALDGTAGPPRTLPKAA